MSALLTRRDTLARPVWRCTGAQLRMRYAQPVRGVPLELRRRLALYDVVRDTAEGTVVRVGAVDVEVLVRGDRLAATGATHVSGIYIDVDRALPGPAHLGSNDRGYAAILIDAARVALDELLAAGGRARLRFGRWEVERPLTDEAARAVELVARLALAPRELAARWATVAAALGASWSDEWSLTPRTRVALPGGTTIEATVDESGAAGLMVRGPRGQVPAPLTFDVAAVAALVARVGPAVAPRAAPAVAVAPLPIADWPSTRRAAHVAPGRPLVTDGADARPGLREELVVDGVPVQTRCADDGRRTEVRAACPGADHLRFEARPGYRFLRSLFLPEPRLGDASFDDRYMLTTSDLGWARWWFGADERAAIAATFHAEATAPFAFQLVDEDVGFAAELAPERRYLDAARIGAAFLAGRGARATDEWRALAASLGGTLVGRDFSADSGLVIRTGRGASAIEITCARRAGGLVTLARAGEEPSVPGPRLILVSSRAPDRLTEPRAGRPPTIAGPEHHDAYATDAAWAAPRLAAIAPVLAGASADRLEVSDGHAVLVWDGPLLDPRRLTAGVELIARISRAGPAGTSAPYR